MALTSAIIESHQIGEPESMASLLLADARLILFLMRH